MNNLERRVKMRTIGPMRSEKIFAFGNGGRLRSQEKPAIPAVIRGHEVTIELDMANSIPLLLAEDKIEILGARRPLMSSKL